MDLSKLKELFSFNSSREFNYDWSKIKLSKHFKERFDERHSSKFSDQELKELLEKESASWEFVVAESDGVEFWQRHYNQCYLFDPKSNTLVTTYSLDFNGFENDFGREMITKMFKELEQIRERNSLKIEALKNSASEKLTEFERLQEEIKILEKRCNILSNEFENEVREKEVLEQEIDNMGMYIVKNRNYQTHMLVNSYKK